MRKNEVSSYQLGCGSVQREVIEDCWIELYKEHNCYHVRMGRVGRKWSRWETFDSSYKSPLKLAREEFINFVAYAKAHFVYPLGKCYQCDSMTINGVYSHERGCPNHNRYWDFYEGEWCDIEEEYIEEE